MPVVAKCKDSLLTTSSGYTNYRGILNLVIILLVLSNARAALENLIKYGLLVDPLLWLELFADSSRHWPALNILVGLGLHLLIALSIEMYLAAPYRQHTGKQPAPPASASANSKARFEAAKQKNGAPSSSQSPSASYISNSAASSKKASPAKRSTSSASAKNATRDAPACKPHAQPHSSLAANCFIVINTVTVIAIPPYIVFTNNTHPVTTSMALMAASIVFLKLVSYHMMNYWCRDLRLPYRHCTRTTRSFLRLYTPPSLEFADSLESAAAAPNSAAASAAADTLPATKPVLAAAAGKARSSSRDTSGVSSIESCSSSPRSLSLVREKSPSSAEATLEPNILSSQELKEATSASLLREQYPQNVTFANLVDFVLVPTLCYDPDFARTKKIRKSFLLKRVLELIILSQLDLALVQQWIVPTVENSLQPFREMKFSLCFERLLKLAIPNHIIWLIWFYLFFHSVLNIIAELTKFADREFYRDWWNSESVHYFWSNWNLPVHKWCLRHLYVPLISFGLTKCQASAAVFLVSAFFHEYLVSVPLKLFRLWAFTGMLMQLPLARFVSAYFNSSFANVAVWMSILIGQPLCILMYYHDYYILNK